MNKTEKKIFSIENEKQFCELALTIFREQASNVPVYSQFIDYLGINPKEITELEKIPFLPIQFFKNHKIVYQNKDPEIIFSSSGTTGGKKSCHRIVKTEIYKQSFTKSFQLFYGNPEDYCILALLPAYLERKGSSLIYMTEHLIKMSDHKKSGFYLYNHKDLYKNLQELEEKGQKTLLLGVSFALVAFAEKYSFPLNHTLIMETGGMKGRREEMTRENLHALLCEKFHLKQIHSEYGMTELLSQAYSSGNGKFFTPPWMKVFIRDSYDPFTIINNNKSGGINIIDLANLYSCSFIETQDIGKRETEGSFQVQGRFDQSDLRGCNLLMYE